MKPCDLDTGATRLRLALKDLQRVWGETSEVWNDSVAEAFFAEHLEPLTPIVKNTLDAVGRMRLLLHEAQRELDS
ncbi:hypothetical protein [Botrimarina hoheduenensis]|uniref:Uncharacterized protein n=1 Tax=Botrimarina hoheduenensis TaxID=2528000 RepID=A0A5C5VXE6_9BACT|nr:hypothetical protein [Botrimarina hoheduenensis]TWT43286.1 hypothetical protein Pla111_22370 [Botrimarina hoheduenensis]